MTRSRYAFATAFAASVFAIAFVAIAVADAFPEQLVPCPPSLDRQMGKLISGIMRGDGGVDTLCGRVGGWGCECIVSQLAETDMSNLSTYRLNMSNISVNIDI